MTLRSTFITAILASAVLARCTGAEKTTPVPQGRIVCVLVDRSSSTEDPAIRQRYVESFRRILEKLGSGDLIVADAITDNPLGQSSFPVNDEFEVFKPDTDNALILRKEQEEHQRKIQARREEIMSKAEVLFASAPSKATKILDATMLASRVFHSDRRRNRVLVIFSDMVEESERYNFRRTRMTDDAIARMIAAERDSKRLPDLTGAKVYVIGAGASGNQLPTSEEFLNIEKFWLEYFKSAGADLPEERYGAALLRFED
jgi:hypothetical protein